jgi:hypothetical protein
MTVAMTAKLKLAAADSTATAGIPHSPVIGPPGIARKTR